MSFQLYHLIALLVIVAVAAGLIVLLRVMVRSYREGRDEAEHPGVNAGASNHRE